MARFMAGDTTLAEERRLYGYFASGSVAGDMLEYAPMMLALGGCRKEHEAKGGGAAGWWWAASVAAMLAVVAMIGFNKLDAEPQYSLYAQYEGSYVMQGGKRNTNIAAIMPRLVEAENRNVAAETDALIDVDGLDEDMQKSINNILDY